MRIVFVVTRGRLEQCIFILYYLFFEIGDVYVFSEYQPRELTVLTQDRRPKNDFDFRSGDSQLACSVELTCTLVMTPIPTNPA